MWNNGREQRKFRIEQEKQRMLYLSVGMTEEQIQTMYDVDKAIFNGIRRETVHKDFADVYECTKQTTEIDTTYISRFSWLNDLQDERLKRINKLTYEDKELLTKYVIDGYKWREIGEMIGISRSAITKRLDRIRKKLTNDKHKKAV